MSIGQALSGARLDAGLTIDDISAKTRLRATVIRAIEADDFSLCGGDFYARGHIRTLAGLVGLDPVPLLAEYDATIGPKDDGQATSQLYETEVTGRAITRTAQKRAPHWGLAAVATTLVAIIVFATIGLLNHNKKPALGVGATGHTGSRSSEQPHANALAESVADRLGPGYRASGHRRRRADPEHRRGRGGRARGACGSRHRSAGWRRLRPTGRCSTRACWPPVRCRPSMTRSGSLFGSATHLRPISR